MASNQQQPHPPTHIHVGDLSVNGPPDDSSSLASAVENLTYGHHFGNGKANGGGSVLYGSSGSLVSVSTTSTLTSTTADNFVMPEDVIKYGKMRKLKNGNRRFFVLRRNHRVEKSHISLSYYDSEKKFRANPDSSSQVPRRTILLKHVWNVHHKFDSKHRFVMAIYTREDMFATLCDDEDSLNDWIKTIRGELSQMGQFFSRPFREYEHIWQVNIARSGLGLSRNIHGLHRLALAGSVLYIFKVDPSNDTPEVYEFPLNIVRKCGHNTSTFFFELGRSSLVGTGTLWLHTEDNSVAQQIHDVVLIAMSAGSMITPSGAVIPLTNHHSSSHFRKRSSDQDNSSISTSSTLTSLPRSNSINSNAQQQQQKQSQQNHRPRSCSEVSKCNTTSQSIINNSSSNGSINSGQTSNRSGSSSRRNSKTLQSPPQLSTCTGSANCSCCLPAQTAFIVHDPQHHCNCGAGHHHLPIAALPCAHPHGPHFVYHLPANAVRTSATQSPANSRERLHSGSWSRTTSECSNEDGGGGGCSGVATPMGCCESCHNLHYFSTFHTCGCQALATQRSSNASLDGLFGHQATSHPPTCAGVHSHNSSSSRCSSHTSSMDCIDATTVLQFEQQQFDCHATSSTGGMHLLDSSSSNPITSISTTAITTTSSSLRNSIVNSISEEVDSDDQYYQMMNPGVGSGDQSNSNNNSKSNSNQSISSMSSFKSVTGVSHHIHQTPTTLHQAQTTAPLRSNSLSTSDRGPTSLRGGPGGGQHFKCCSSGHQGSHHQQHSHHHSHHSHIYSGFSPLPTLQAGTDADYLPMTPLSQQKKDSDKAEGNKAEGSEDKVTTSTSTTTATTFENQTVETAATSTTPTTTTTSTTPATSEQQPDSTASEASNMSVASSAPKEDSTAGTPMDEEDGYLDMTPSTESMSTSTNKMATTTASTSASSITTSASSSSTANIEQKLEKVHSYYGDQSSTNTTNQTSTTCIHQQPDSSKDDSFLTRAYSMGSRPEPLAPSIAAQCTTSPSNAAAGHQHHHQHHQHLQPQSGCADFNKNIDPRTRAFSMGSHGLSMSHGFRANRLHLRRHNQQANKQANSSSFEGGCEPMTTAGSSSSSSSLAEIEEGCCLESTGESVHHHFLSKVPECCFLSSKAASSASAPILSHLQQVRARSATLGARPNLHGVTSVGGSQYMKTSQSGGPFQTHQLQLHLQKAEEHESDLMEIDYTGKEPQQKTRSAFEEEIREAKKASSRNRKNSTGGSEAVFAALKSGGSTSLDGSTAVQPKSSSTAEASTSSSTTTIASSSTNPPGRKRADSTSAISSFFGPARPSGHHVTFRTGSSTFDNFVSTFRQSLNLAQSSSSSASTSESKDSGSKAATTATNESKLKSSTSSTEAIEDGPSYMMTCPQSSSSSKSTADAVSSSSGSASSPCKAPPPTPTNKMISSSESLTNNKAAVSSSEHPKSIMRKSKDNVSAVVKAAPAVTSSPMEEDAEEYTLMAPNVIINRPSLQPKHEHHQPSSPEPTSTAPAFCEASAPINMETIQALTRKMEESARQQKLLQQQQQQLLQLQRQRQQQQKQQTEEPVYSMHRYDDSDEEASPYVMMTPHQEDKSASAVSSSSSGRKTAPNSTTSNVQKKQKTSALRSLVSSLGSKSTFSFASSSSSSSNANADTTSSGSSRKKSSTFSGRLLLNRSNSGHQNQQQQNGSSNDSKRKKGSSKSESSSGGSPPGGLASPPPPSNCSTDHATATTSSTTSVNSMSALAS